MYCDFIRIFRQQFAVQTNGRIRIPRHSTIYKCTSYRKSLIKDPFWLFEQVIEKGGAEVPRTKIILNFFPFFKMFFIIIFPLKSLICSLRRKKSELNSFCNLVVLGE